MITWRKEKMTKRTLLAKVRRLKKLKAQQEKVDQQMKAIENEIKSEMEAKEIEEMQVDVFRIRYIEVLSNRFDNKAFKIENQELFNRYIKPTVTRRFTVA